jgi:hypothetical protein
MNSIQCYKDRNNFIDHPLAPLFYQFVETLEKRGFYKEAGVSLTNSRKAKSTSVNL